MAMVLAIEAAAATETPGMAPGIGTEAATPEIPAPASEGGNTALAKIIIAIASKAITHTTTAATTAAITIIITLREENFPTAERGKAATTTRPPDPSTTGIRLADPLMTIEDRQTLAANLGITTIEMIQGSFLLLLLLHFSSHNTASSKQTNKQTKKAGGDPNLHPKEKGIFSSSPATIKAAALPSLLPP